MRAAAGKICTGLAVGLMLWTSSVAQACTTPVYRYAMYNWAPAPFVVFYVHYGQPAEEDEPVHQLITDLGETGPALANLVVQPVDLTRGDFDRVPVEVQDAWLAQVRAETEKARPAHLLFTYWGAELFGGRLDAATVRAMVDSPARTKIAELLQGGCGMVILLLPGSDAEENERAEKVAREVIDGVASGTIPIASGLAEPDYYQEMPAPETSGDASADSDGADDDPPAGQSNRLQLGLLKVARSDPAEKWFLASLMKMEPDLHELADQPMIFFFYGRGRAMWPYVGKGITADNLAAEAQFLAGPCSCMVKDQNPGLDQLMHWDWDATAEAMARSDPSMYADPYGYQEYSLDEVGNAEPSDVAADEEVATSVVASPPDVGDASPPEAGVSQRVESVQTTVEEETAKAAPESSGGTPAVEPPQESAASTAAEKPGAAAEKPGAATAKKPVAPPGDSFAQRQTWMLALFLLLAAAVVVLAGFLLIRKQAPAGRRPAP